MQDFVNYAVAVAERYKGRIRTYQVWNEPNIYPEWGNQDVSPEAYTDMLCRTYTALKAVDPDIVVVSGALAPTLALSGRDLSDTIYLQRMYQAGAGACFDVLSVQGYGFNSGPTDRRMRPTYFNFAHNLYLRDLMVRNGDAHKPIWISEAAWNPQPRDPALVTSLYGNYGIVTPEEAARYMPLAYQRAQQEWPWVGPIFYWFFKRPADTEINQSWYYFRMVEPDFTPLPVYESMKDSITDSRRYYDVSYSGVPKLYPGVHQENNWAIRDMGQRPVFVDVADAQFGQAAEVNTPLFVVRGTDVLVRWRGEGQLDALEAAWSDPFALTEGTLSISNTDEQDGWRHGHITFLNQTLPQPVSIVVWASTDDGLVPSGETTWLLDSITVLDRTYEHLFGPVAAGLIGLGMLAWVLVSALRERQKIK